MIMKLRKMLSADGLINVIHQGFKKIKDFRSTICSVTLADALMSVFAMFSLKDPSLLKFDERRQTDDNLGSIYKIDHVPCDTHIRTILDKVDPEDIKPIFKDIFRQAQRGKVLEPMVFMDGCYLLSGDGTGFFSSKKVHCPNCMEKVNKKTGEITYHHQMFASSIVHPDVKGVIPLIPEPIVKQDGETKNDCERNAAKRHYKQVRLDHPHLGLIVVEDALHSNAPHIKDLTDLDMHYIIGVKEGDHAFLFAQVENAEKAGKVTHHDVEEDGVIHRFRFINDMPLNASNQDVRVNFVEYWQIKDGKTLHFSWITELTVTTENVYKIMRGGRARWKIENETFNTLKNQGYHFEHNFGHGEKNLCTVFAMIMMLAFLVDQVQQLACPLFQELEKAKRTRISIWNEMRHLFHTLPFASMGDLFKAMLYGFKVNGIIIYENST